MQKQYPVNHIFKIDNFFFKRLDDGENLECSSDLKFPKIAAMQTFHVNLFDKILNRKGVSKNIVQILWQLITDVPKIPRRLRRRKS